MFLSKITIYLRLCCFAYFCCFRVLGKHINTELSGLPLLVSPSWPTWITGKADAALNYYFCQNQKNSYHHIIHINTKADQLEGHLEPQIISGSWIIFRVDYFVCVWNILLLREKHPLGLFYFYGHFCDSHLPYILRTQMIVFCSFIHSPLPGW